MDRLRLMYLVCIILAVAAVACSVTSPVPAALPAEPAAGVLQAAVAAPSAPVQEAMAIAGPRPLLRVPPVLGEQAAAPAGPLLVRPVDPATLEDLPGYPPLDFGHHHAQALSPDGQTLAVLSWPTGSPMDRRGGSLRLVDLASWTERATGVMLPEQAAGPPAWSADGRWLYWLLPERRDPAHGVPRSYRLHRFDITGGEATAAGALPGRP